MFGHPLGQVPVERSNRGVESLEQRHQAGGGCRARLQQSCVLHGSHGGANRFDPLLNACLGARVVLAEEALDGLGLGTLQLLQSGPALEEVAPQRGINIIDPVQRLGKSTF
jgi:hypothetical protein